MSVVDDIKGEKAFKERLKGVMELSDKEKTERIALEMYYQGVQYANDEVPWEEVQNMGLDNEPDFLRGYNETLEKLGKSR